MDGLVGLISYGYGKSMITVRIYSLEGYPKKIREGYGDEHARN